MDIGLLLNEGKTNCKQTSPQKITNQINGITRKLMLRKNHRKKEKKGKEKENQSMCSYKKKKKNRCTQLFSITGIIIIFFSPTSFAEHFLCVPFFLLYWETWSREWRQKRQTSIHIDSTYTRVYSPGYVQSILFFNYRILLFPPPYHNNNNKKKRKGNENSRLQKCAISEHFLHFFFFFVLMSV